MDNKRIILEKALELFHQKGYDSVGIQEICNESGITKPTMYHYFGSKLGLLESILEEKYTDLCVQLTQVADRMDKIEISLYEFADVLFRFAHENPQAYMLLMSLSYSAKENEGYLAVKPYISRIYGLGVELFEGAADELGNMNGRQEQFAIGFLGLVNHYIMLLGYRETTDTITQVSEEKKRSLIHQYMHGIWT